MKNIEVNLGTTNMKNIYILKPTKRIGFYSLDAASFSSIVSKNSISITSMRDGEDKKQIVERIERIKAKAFAQQ